MMGKHAGSLDRVHPNAGVPVISHFFHDIVPYQDCCRLTNNCEKYFEKRPSDDGSLYQAPRPGIIISYEYSVHGKKQFKFSCQSEIHRKAKINLHPVSFLWEENKRLVRNKTNAQKTTTTIVSVTIE